MAQSQPANNTGDLLGQFISWERLARDIIDFKRIYVDLTTQPGKLRGDTLSGLMLSQIVYYHLPDRRGNPRLHIERGGYLWLVKRRTDWWNECRLTTKQVDRCLGILGAGRQIGTKKTGRWEPGCNLLTIELHRFRKAPTQYIRLNFPVFLVAWQSQVDRLANSILPYGDNATNSISPDGENQIISPDGQDQISPDGQDRMLSPDGEIHLQKKKDTGGEDKEVFLDFPEITPRFARFLQEIRMAFTIDTYNSLFMGVVPTAMTEDSIVIGVPSSLIKERIEGFIWDRLNDIAESVFGPGIGVEIVVKPDANPPTGAGSQVDQPLDHSGVDIPLGQWADVDY